MAKAPNKAEKDRMNKISQMPCVVCLIHKDVETPASVHHILDTGRRKGHMFTIPLCFAHHQSGVNNSLYTSRHPFKKEFELRYGREEYLLSETNKRIDGY